MKTVKALVVLETMWGTAGRAPRFFQINPQNFSGRRLYSLLGHSDFLVTNACSQQVNSAREHARPDPIWLAKNLQIIRYGVLILCGRVAQATYEVCEYEYQGPVVRMPHPASRQWSKEKLEFWRKELAKYYVG